MIEPIILRGIAAPFGIVAAVGDGVVEEILPNAFSDQIAYDLDCSVKLDTHDRAAPDIACTRNHTLFLFQAACGLCFEAHITPNIQDFGSVAWELHNRKYARASVSFRLREVDLGDDGIERVTQAQADHIALTNTAAYGGWTGVWDRNTPPENMTARLFNMNERWQQGYRAHLNAKSEKAVTVKPAMTASHRVAMSADTRAAEQRLAEQLKEHSHRSAALLRETILGRLARTESK